MKPYTYLIIFKPTGQAYYGVRFAKNCDPSDLWVSYFTSSKTVHKLIEEYGVDSFDYEIRREFNNRDDAMNWEQKVIQRLNAVRSSNWLNRGCSNLQFAQDEQFIEKRIKYMTGTIWYHHPETLKEVPLPPHQINYYVSQGYVKGRSCSKTFMTKEWKYRRSKQYTGERNPAFGLERKDLSARNKIPKRWMHNGIKTKQVPLDQVDFWLDEGFVFGRPF